ncbi:retrovirus-related pol polyprotein from transposon TNT 1-94 [Tanacetum coccineum]
MKAKLALLEASPSTSQALKASQLKSKGLVAETFDSDEEEVSDDEEETRVQVLITPADDELFVGKRHARNDEWVDITMKKVNTLLSMDEDLDWQNYLRYINIDLKDDQLVLKQAKLETITFQIQDTKLTKLNYALQEQIKEERRVNEKCLTSSKKVSQCISDEIPSQKKKILVPDAQQPQITNHALTSSYLVAQDRWSQTQHIKLVNIIGDLGEGMLTRSMAAKLTTASASECLFLDFLSEIEPKKVSEALKHPSKIAIGSKWVYRNKKYEHVARMEAIRIFPAFATYMNFIVFQMDAKSAFLNGKLKEEVYVKQPPGFESSEFLDYVYKFDKALYGLKQASRAWYETLSTFLIQNKWGRIDNTLFIYRTKEDVLLVQVYVDDIIFGLTSYKLCKQFEKLMTKKFEMSMIGELTYFLRLQFKQDDKGISICQEQYTRSMLKKYEISNSCSMKTPMVPPNNLGPDLAGKPINETLYRGMIGKLMYLKGTPSFGLCYPNCSGFDLKGYSESDYASCNMDRKITSGACQILGGKLVCWSAKKQVSVAISSAKAEYVATARCCANIL